MFVKWSMFPTGFNCYKHTRWDVFKWKLWKLFYENENAITMTITMQVWELLVFKNLNTERFFL